MRFNNLLQQASLSVFLSVLFARWQYACIVD